MGRPTAYKKKYANELVEYFMRFLDLRDDPVADDKAERSGMVTIDLSDPGGAKVTRAPCSGYPSLIKFAKKIGVTPQTLQNWKDKHEDFAEAMEFADMIQDEVLNERALFGKVDGKVAMKIRELKAAAKREAKDELGVGGLKIEFRNFTESKIELKEYEGEVNEDTEYS